MAVKLSSVLIVERAPEIVCQSSRGSGEPKSWVKKKEQRDLDRVYLVVSGVLLP